MFVGVCRAGDRFEASDLAYAVTRCTGGIITIVVAIAVLVCRLEFSTAPLLKDSLNFARSGKAS